MLLKLTDYWSYKPYQSNNSIGVFYEEFFFKAIDFYNLNKKINSIHETLSDFISFVDCSPNALFLKIDQKTFIDRNFDINNKNDLNNDLEKWYITTFYKVLYKENVFWTDSNIFDEL